ncbi:MAG: hypothetical protein ACYCVN_12430 [Acidimicrobiales bacterium]
MTFATTRCFETDRGDVVMLHLVNFPGQAPTVLVQITDADESFVPTAEFTMAEAGAFRDALRQLCEAGSRANEPL